MIQIKALVKNYKVNEDAFPVLKGLNCTIHDGEFVSILGPSGCGKSTFLNILAGLMRADGGEIVVNGRSTKDYTDADWDDWRKNQVGMVFQSYHLIPHLNALQNVEMAMSVAGCGKKERRNRAKQLLERVGLSDRMKNRPNQLSGGQRQRVAIARALANHPAILLADEPTGALDQTTTKEIMELLHSLNEQEGITVIMVTHDEKIAAETQRSIRLLDGEIVEDIYFEKGEEEKTDVCVGRPKKSQNMKWMEWMKVAFRNLWVKRKRTFLTVLGISVAVFSVSAIFGITNGIADKVENELDTLSGASCIRVEVEKKSKEEITELLDMLKKEEHVTSVENVYVLYGFILLGDKYTEQTIYSKSDDAKKDALLYGEYPKNVTEIVISKGVSERLGGKDNPEKMIGKIVKVISAYGTESEVAYQIERNCKVVGISNVNVLGSGENYVTSSCAEDIANESLGKKANAQKLFVNLDAKENRQEVLNRVKEKNFTISDSEEMVKNINGWVNAIKKFLLLITGISLLVALVMVVIVQYMSVAERIREIGILRAIGAKKSDVRNIFLSEAGVIGVLSGVIGIGVAVFLGNGINEVIYELLKVNAFELYQLHLPVMTVCLLTSVVLCLLAGYFPAKQAASVDVIEVLR